MKLAALILFPLSLFITLTTQWVEAAPCNDVIVAQVMSRYKLDSSYQIEVLTNQLADKETESSAVTFKALSQKEPLGLFTVLMTVTNTDKTRQTVQVRMRVSKFANVVVANDRINKGEMLNASQVEVTRMDVTNLREQPLLLPEQVISQIAKRNIQVGSIMTTGCVALPPAVASGRPVTILYEHAGCRITVPGIALQKCSDRGIRQNKKYYLGCSYSRPCHWRK
jgi:flagella basal body P-ring formation protein FlgA